jgi:transposase
MSRPTQPGLFTTQAQGDAPTMTAINARCSLLTEDELRVVRTAGLPFAHWMAGDRMAEAQAMVNLVAWGWADQVEVARAFGCSTRTVRRHQRRYEDGGLTALGRSSGYPSGRPRLGTTDTKIVMRLHANGASNRAIAGRLGITEKAVRKRLRRLGVRPRAPEQTELLLEAPTMGADPNLSAPPVASMSPTAAPQQSVPPTTPAEPATGADPNLSAPPVASMAPTPAPQEPAPPTTPAEPATGADPNLSACLTLDTDPADRRFDRLLAHLGLIDDALPMFRSDLRVPRAGVLLALGPLLDSGVLDVAGEIYGSIGPAFYGLRTTLVALLFMALLRIKRPEALKEHAPGDLGRLLGLDRAPEVKTLRRKLVRLAAVQRAVDFGRALAVRRVRERGAALGFLYADGHVRVYHGKHSLPKAHVARMRIAMPGTTDYWVNDMAGEPLFVITAPANAGLAKMLPPILQEIRTLLGQRRVTIVFDRGGWSPKLFKSILDGGGFDILTYRKGRSRRVAKSRFHSCRTTLDGHQVDYILADQGIRLLRGKLRLRQVTRLSVDGHQTPIVTSRLDLSAPEVAFRMFERWRQENFFKYLREEYALDALVDYDVEGDDPTREVPNPRWAAVDAELRKALAEVERLSAIYGVAAFSNPEALRPTMRGFKIANAPQGHQLVIAVQRYIALKAKRAAIPRRVPVDKVVDGQVVKLAAERKHLTDLLKMVAYQAESDLVRLIAPHYARSDDEGRTLVQNILASPADLDVVDGELRVAVHPLSSEHRTRALVALCASLDARRLVFPGTTLRVRYSVTDQP